METNIVNLRDAKWEKDAPFKVAETRLGNRHQRPNVEMCRDEPSHRYDFDIFITPPRLSDISKKNWGAKTGTIQPGLRLVPSGNFFLALNRSHHVLLTKVRI